jgi:hypothetical protein
LSVASGLLPFLAWIGSDDHTKDSNFVVDDLGNGRLRIVAIDFEHAFPWRGRKELEAVITAPEPPGLSKHFDPQIVNRALQLIEALTPQEIATCCVNSGIAPKLAKELVDTLHGRQSLLRGR